MSFTAGGLMRVSDVMVAQVWSVSRSWSLNDALKLMWEHDVGVVPVVDAEGRVVGMLTDRDVAMATFLRGRRPAEIPVADTMSRAVFGCRPDESIAGAERIMRERKVRRLPVLDLDRRLVGIVTLADLARATCRNPMKAASNGLIRTFEEITHPRHVGGGG